MIAKGATQGNQDASIRELVRPICCEITTGRRRECCCRRWPGGRTSRRAGRRRRRIPAPEGIQTPGPKGGRSALDERTGFPLAPVGMTVNRWLAGRTNSLRSGSVLGKQCRQRLPRARRAHERFADQESVYVVLAHQLDITRCQDAALADDDTPGRNFW